MDELMKHLRLTSQTSNLLMLLAAWPTDSNSFVCCKGGSPRKTMSLEINNLDLQLEQLYFTCQNFYWRQAPNIFVLIYFVGGRGMITFISHFLERKTLHKKQKFVETKQKMQNVLFFL